MSGLIIELVYFSAGFVEYFNGMIFDVFVE